MPLQSAIGNPAPWHPGSVRGTLRIRPRSVSVLVKTVRIRRRTPVITCQASENYYELLGVEQDAEEEAIKAAFRRRAKEWHPDVNPEPEAENRFKECNEAYETLSDPARRTRYDAELRSKRCFRNFFQDVDFADDETAPWRHDDDDGEPQSSEDARTYGGGGTETDMFVDPYEFMQNLSRYQSSFAPGRAPGVAGDGASASWYQRVQQQVDEPGSNFGRRSSRYGDDKGGPAWADPRQPEWTPPGWRRPEEQGDDDEEGPQRPGHPRQPGIGKPPKWPGSSGPSWRKL